jgi:hypothetical protein
MRRCLAWLAALSLSASVSTAFAQTEDRARALELFEEGRKLMTSAETLAQACDKLEESYALHARGDTLLNLAECHRRQGKTASAWREFDAALRVAREVEFTDAEKIAAELRDQLAKELSRLTVRVPTELAGQAGLAVRLDGEPLAAAEWGKPMIIDPGPHRVEAELAGYKPFTANVEVGPKSDNQEVAVALERVPAPKPPPPKPAPTPAPVVEEPGIPIWAWISAGAGVALIGVSIPFGIDTRDAGEDLDAGCGPERLACAPGYDFESDRSRELRSFGLFVGLGAGGIIALGVGVAGIAMGLTSSEQATSFVPWIDPDGAGLRVGVNLP